MDQTPNLALPYIMAAQAQKHITHNEAIRALDSLVQLMVLDRDLTAPPGAPADGDRYIVAPSATGEWAGHDLEIAAYQDGAWAYYVPGEGWLLWIADEDIAVAWDGTAWSALSSGGGGTSDHGALTGLSDDDHTQYHNDARGDARYTPINPTTLGVNATPDATNKFAVASDATLFNNNGAGHQQKINKNAAGDTASQLYQTGFSGRAEIGLTGDDDFHFKVSPDGSSWVESMKIDKTTGAVTHLAGARHTFGHDATNAGFNMVPAAGDPSSPSNGDVWYNSTTGKFRKRQGGATSDLGTGSPAPTRQIFTASGTWTKPAGCTRVRVRVVAGGGAGGGAVATGAGQCSAGAGGGGGGLADEVIDVTSTSSETVTVGAGGAGVAGTSGGAGGSSSFGAFCSATGGNGGSASTASSNDGGVGSGAGGNGTGGDINCSGQAGETGWRIGGNFAQGGMGGMSAGAFGGGARGPTAGSGGSAAGANADGYGAGGSGAANGNSKAAVAGGDGSDGIVIVDEFYD